MREHDKQYVVGVWYCIITYCIWGFLPLYWNLLDGISASEIVAHRIIWSFVFVSFVLVITLKWPNILKECKQIFQSRRLFLLILASTAVISANWFAFIWGVNSGKVVEVSLGYYINPLLSVLLGILVFKERLTIWLTISFLLAATGVAILIIQYGQIPWIAFCVSSTFALYGVTKKLANLNSMIGLMIETLLVLPFALIYITTLQVQGVAVFGAHSMTETLLLISTGAATAIPLLGFAQGAKRIPLSMIGFLQYIAPSIILLLGIFVFQEPFSTVHLISFIFIWCALTIYSLSKTKMVTAIEMKISKKNSLEG